MEQTFLKITDTHTADSYPYGRLRTKAFFSVEFKAGKGFRTVFQTVDPKNGRINAPKKSTYHNFCWNTLNPHNGHIETNFMSFYDPKLLNVQLQKAGKICEEIGATPEMIKQLAATAIQTLIGNYTYNNADTKKLLWPVIEPAVKVLNEIIKTGSNKLAEARLNKEDYESAEKQGTPVKWVMQASEPVNIFDL